MVNIIAHIIAKNPPSILLALGSIGLLAGLSGAGTLLGIGTFLQVLWLAKFFI